MTSRSARRLVWIATVALGCGSEPSPPATEEPLFIGVIPFGAGDKEECPAGPDREPVTFWMDDDNSTRCTSESGDPDQGGNWVLPDVVKQQVPYPCVKAARNYTVLPFCRVPVGSNAFRPLTTDPARREDFYAVLRFGARCPPGSVEIAKRIWNEENDNANRSTGDITPNEITDARIDTFYTRLKFCYFRAASSETETMGTFPDLGFPYAVFHDFDAVQPGWVISKRWKMSDDSNNSGTNKNHYEYRGADEQLGSEFAQLIENPVRGGSTDTYFDMARVR